MKNNLFCATLVFFLPLLYPTIHAQVSINTNASTPHASAMLDVTSTNKGILVPRLTTNQRTTIDSPATGLLVFDSELSEFYYYNGSAWTSLTTEPDVDWLRTNGNTPTAIGNSIYTLGNVGIGTSSPSFPMDIRGTGGERLRVYTTDGLFAGVVVKNSSREFFMGVQATYETTDASSGFHIYDNTAGSQRLVIDKDGDVGIGQANPNAKLHVKGDVRIVDGSQGAGKVLTSDASGFASWTILSVDDADATSTNELNTSAILNGSSLEITDAGGTISVELSSLQSQAWLYNSGSGNIGEVYHAGQVSVGTTTATVDGGDFRLLAERNSSDGAAVMGYNRTSRGLLGVWDNSLPDVDLPNVQSVGVLGYSPDFANNSRASVYGYAENAEGTAYAGMFQAVGANAQVNYGIYAKAANSSNNNFVGYFVGDKSYFDGRIGLGTATPDNKLHASSSSASTILRTENTGTGDASLVAETPLGEIRLGVQGSTDPSPGQFHIYDEAASLQLMEIQTNQQFMFYGDVTASNANLSGTLVAGANTATPNNTALNGGEAIVIPGSSSDYLISVQDGNGRVQHKWNATYGTGEEFIVSGEDAAFIDLNATASDNNSAWIEFKHADGASAVAGDAISWNTQLIINQGGEVGINETSPDDMLHVTAAGSGTRIRAENSGTGWAGFLSKNTAGEMFIGLQGALDANQGEFHIYDNVAGARRMVIDSAGEVGIGRNNPSAKLDVNGTVLATAFTQSSDIRLKKNVQPLQNSLANILKLQGVTYLWRASEFPERDFEDQAEQVGLIAQEVEKVYPQLVKTDNEGYKAVNYTSLTAILLEGIKEQQEQLQATNSNLSEMKEELTRLKKENEALQTQAQRLTAVEAKLLHMEQGQKAQHEKTK